MLQEWQHLTDQQGQALSPDLPVLFHVNGNQTLEPDDYVVGQTVCPGCYWDGRDGWQPCVMVELGEAF